MTKERLPASQSSLALIPSHASSSHSCLGAEQPRPSLIRHRRWTEERLGQCTLASDALQPSSHAVSPLRISSLSNGVHRDEYEETETRLQASLDVTLPRRLDELQRTRTILSSLRHTSVGSRILSTEAARVRRLLCSVTCEAVRRACRSSEPLKHGVLHTGVSDRTGGAVN